MSDVSITDLIVRQREADARIVEQFMSSYNRRGATHAVLGRVLDAVRSGALESVTVPTENEREALIQTLKVAMLGTTDGGFIDMESDIPAGEMFRLAAEWVTANTNLQPVQVEVTDDDEHVPLQAAYDDIKAEYAEYRNSVRAKLDIDTVRTVDELNALPVGAVVISEAGTIACRFDERKFVCFGDERPGEAWSLLALPARVLYRPAALGGGDHE